jgi:hypothetical protein
MNVIFLGAFLSIGDQKIQCDSYILGAFLSIGDQKIQCDSYILGAFLSIDDQKIQCDSCKGVLPKKHLPKLLDFKGKKII